MEAISNTAPMINSEGKRLTRKFLGDIHDGSAYGRKHLNSYMKGADYFYLGRDEFGNRYKHIVRQEYSYVN
jgi:hypothetical protein